VASTKPVARFTVSPREPSTSDTVQLLDCSRDPREVGIAWRAWDFGDGVTSVGPAPVHRYASAGDYEITLTLATFDGRVSRRCSTLRVRLPVPEARYEPHSVSAEPDSRTSV
jgi:PKD domain